ncbi:hypothetical protein WR25_18468 [Diploscapter pachys]|uniref:Uncharacterized protein n=1 Tax=Diploscapter pachys TaxID=2018661 RepID=A0A2A2K0A7_9BILA|nr:hypothetical protein WR25_18468 [Diploscapter pachys]
MPVIQQPLRVARPRCHERGEHAMQRCLRRVALQIVRRGPHRRAGDGVMVAAAIGVGGERRVIVARDQRPHALRRGQVGTMAIQPQRGGKVRGVRPVALR